MAKHTLAELREKQDREREELQATTDRQLIERFRQETRTDTRQESDERLSAPTF